MDKKSTCYLCKRFDNYNKFFINKGFFGGSSIYEICKYCSFIINKKLQLTIHQVDVKLNDKQMKWFGGTLI